jgi:plastocyanin
MRRIWLLASVAAVAAVAAVLAPATAQPAGQWSTVKGQVVYPEGKAVPERKKLDVTQDKAHCLSKGDILDESLVVNPKNRGIKNVVVWLRPDNMDPRATLDKEQIHPSDANRKVETVSIDQPVCMFSPRITIARVGDTIEAKNSAPVAHNFFWTSANNGEYNVTIPANSAWKMPQALVPEASPIQYKCTIHPWMTGYVRIYDHPYYAVTDEDGKFTIKNAPTGKFRMIVWHEKAGFLGGKEGRFGMPIEIGGETTELKPIEFDIMP